MTTKEDVELQKKAILERDGGYTNGNADALLALNKLLDTTTMTRVEANKIRDEAGLVKMDVPVNVVKVPEHQAWTEEAISLIKAKVAPNATQTEFELLMYLASKYNLDPLLRQIWLVKFGDSPAQIYAGRDGFLEIAHRSGHFDGMDAGVDYDEKGEIVAGWCKVWRNDMTHPFTSKVLFKEYTTKKNLWLTKPSVMIQKVAESVCLRKAFQVSGLYSPEETG